MVLKSLEKIVAFYFVVSRRIVRNCLDYLPYSLAIDVTLFHARNVEVGGVLQQLAEFVSALAGVKKVAQA